MTITAKCTMAVAMAAAGNGRCHGNRIMGTCRGHDGMRPPKFHPNQFIDRRVIAFSTFGNMAAVRHFEFGDITILWKCLTTPPFWVFLQGVEPLNIVGRHPNPQKAHPWVTTRHLSHKWLKSVQGFDLGGVARKKYNQDRTGQQKKLRPIGKVNGEAQILPPCKIYIH